MYSGSPPGTGYLHQEFLQLSRLQTRQITSVDSLDDWQTWDTRDCDNQSVLTHPTALSRLTPVFDTALNVPTIIVEDLTTKSAHSAGSYLNCSSLSTSGPRFVPLACSGSSSDDLHASCSLRVPYGTWSDENTLVTHSGLRESPGKVSQSAQSLHDSLSERPWLDFDDSYSLSGDPGATSASELLILGTLGRGGYGKVLLAERCSPNTVESQSTRVAVKVLSKKRMTLDDVQELKTEVQILRLLAREASTDPEHGVASFVQNMQSVFQSKEHVFITIDHHCAPLSHPYFRRTLRLRFPCPMSPQPGPFPASLSLPIAFPSSTSISTPYEEALDSLRLLSAELVLGLLYLHSQGIIHQDVKPANILISTDGHAVISDFGSSRLMPRLQEMNADRLSYHANDPDFFSDMHFGVPSKTRSMHFGPIVLGPDDQVSFTRRYAAPELLGAHAPVEHSTHGFTQDRDVLVYDERVDFYSLGVMLRELAMGDSLDHSDAKRQDDWERASDGQRARSSELELSPEFRHFTDQLLATYPTERLHGPEVKDHVFFESINELWDDIAKQRHPPFTDVVWQEPDEDTTLDRRAYSGPDDSQDSLASKTQAWKASQLEDIPFDSLMRAPSCVEVAMPSPSELARRPLFLPTAISSSCSTSTLHVPMSSSEDLAAFAPSHTSAKRAQTSFHDGQNGARVLRRRPRVYDLRQAFLLGPDTDRPAHDVKTGPRHAPVALMRAADVKPRAPASAIPWSFEHQITIALLATMAPTDRRAPHTMLASSPGRAGSFADGVSRVKGLLHKLKMKRSQ
ncbi:kinase-like domain-containing protein [Cubamyces lactineus]|nr:kinase-like domain-containing protein [Cubamyces lactineus]